MFLQTCFGTLFVFLVIVKAAPSPSLSPPDKPAPGSQVELFLEKEVKLINKYRLMHAAAPLQLSLDLTNKAELWATEMANQDKERIDVNSKFGQNIFTSTKEAKDAVTKSVQSWYNQIRFYDFHSAKGSLKSSYFTQLVWVGSQEVGLGKAQSASGKTYIVALFNPPGNKGNYLHNVLPVTGLSKTGTKTIGKALRHLGFTVFDWEEQIFDTLDHWVDVFQNGVKPDVKQVYQNADAVVDLPGVFFFEEILEAFPDCKVILSERDEDSWVKSLVHQLESFFAARPNILMLSPTGNKMNYVMDSTIIAALGSCNTKSTSVYRKRYRIHNHRVRSTVSADKLLVYNVKQGWKPLCEFLECEVPTIDFPHENMKAEILKSLPMTRWVRQVNREVQRGVLAIVSVFLIIVISVLAICFRK